MRSLSSLIFHNFWNVFALCCALGEWALVVAFAGAAPPPPWSHPAALAALFVVNRAAAIWCERERHRAPVTSRLGQAALVVGFGSFLVAGFVGAAGLAFAAWGVAVPAATARGLTTAAAPWADFAPVARAAAALGVLVVGWGYAVGPRRLRVRTRAIAVPGLPAAFDGYTVVHLSDLHLGPIADRRTLRRALERANRAQADLVCITGDLVDSRHCDLAAWMPELRRLRARDGVLAILGNHDRDAGADAVAAAVARHTPIRLLRDDVATIRRGAATLAVIGLEDRHPPHVTASLPALLATVPAGATRVLLAHHPDAFPDAVSAGIPLTLAGHTHAGQLAVPFFRHLNVAHALVSAYDVGWFRTETHRLHVSAGLGGSGQLLRIGTRPEVTVIRLAAVASSAAA